MIVFGQNHFKIRSFTPEELGIPQEQGTQRMEIQVRQRYAHLFWIPFFPIGKLWAIKKQGHSDLFELSEPVIQLIKSRYQIKTPWYSYSLLLLGMAVGLFFIISGKVKDISRENAFYQELAEKRMMVKYPTTGDFYTFDIYDDPDEYEKTRVLLKVNAYDDETIEFTSAYEDLYVEMENSYDLTEATHYKYNATTINKEDLLTLYASDSEDGLNGDKKIKISALGRYVRIYNMRRQELLE